MVRLDVDSMIPFRFCKNPLSPTITTSLSFTCTTPSKFQFINSNQLIYGYVVWRSWIVNGLYVNVLFRRSSSLKEIYENQDIILIRLISLFTCVVNLIPTKFWKFFLFAVNQIENLWTLSNLCQFSFELKHVKKFKFSTRSICAKQNGRIDHILIIGFHKRMLHSL